MKRNLQITVGVVGYLWALFWRAAVLLIAVLAMVYAVASWHQVLV